MRELTTKPSIIKKKQYRTLLIAIAVLGILSVGCYAFFAHQSTTSPAKDKEETITMDSSLAHVDAQGVWMERAQHQLAEQVKATGALAQQLQLLQQSKVTQDKTTQDQAHTLQALQGQVDILQKQLVHASGHDNHSNEIKSSVIFDQSLSLVSKKNPVPVPNKNSHTFVPAGTFVRAIALGGADAPASVTSQGNPTPMVFRLVNKGTLPNHQKSMLKNCLATAAAVGDISSERGAIRLERLSCVKSKGEIIDIPVEATVFGPDGKNGVRGNPVWREGALLRRAFAAGTLSGLANSLGQGFTSSSVNALGNAQTLVDSSKMAHYGTAQGLSNAAEKLADYNVKRAEQYHPVIQLSAGTLVDIVFLKGFYLDGRKQQDNDQDYLASTTPTIETGRIKELEASEEAIDSPNKALAPLPLTPQQIQSLKAKDAQLGYF